MSRCSRLLGLLFGLSFAGLRVGEPRGQRRHRRQLGDRRDRQHAVVMNPPSTYTPERRLQRGVSLPAGARAAPLHLPDLQHRHRRDRLHELEGEVLRRHEDRPPRERQRHRLGGDRLRHADRRLHERPADVRRALELRQVALRRQRPHDLVSADRPVGKLQQLRLGDRRRRGHGLRAADGEQAVERRELRVRRDDADRQHLHPRGERHHPAGRRQLRRERPERARPVLLRALVLPRVRHASTRATTGWACSTSATRSWPRRRAATAWSPTGSTPAAPASAAGNSANGPVLRLRRLPHPVPDRRWTTA